MSNSLRDQLLGLGYKNAPKPEKKPEPKPAQRADKPAQRADKPAHPRDRNANPASRGKPHGGQHAGRPSAPRPHASNPSASKPGQGKPSTREEIDLAKAYAIRAQREKDERIAAEVAKQEEARQKREAKAKLGELVKGQSHNVADADIARHFPYGGKIKRIYVTADQLKALNAGELGVLQIDGRYLLVDADVLAQAEAIFPAAVALKVDPNAPAEGDPYADPQFQVPDDLVW